MMSGKKPCQPQQISMVSQLIKRQDSKKHIESPTHAPEMFWLTTLHFVQKKTVEHTKTDAAHETFIFKKRLLTGNMSLDATASGGFPFTSMFNFHFRDTKRGLFQPHGVAC